MLRPERLPPLYWAEIGIRIALAVFLLWVGSTDPDQAIVLVLCVVAALYHLFAAARLASFRLPSATGLTLDARGLVLRRLWRDRRVMWDAILRMELQQARPLSGIRAGVVLTLGDSKGPVEMLAIPDVFAPGPNQLLAELQHRRAG